MVKRAVLRPFDGFGGSGHVLGEFNVDFLDSDRNLRKSAVLHRFTPFYHCTPFRTPFWDQFWPEVPMFQHALGSEPVPERAIFPGFPGF